MATSTFTSSLPPTFTSAYRLFLRATSASVLHHSTAKRNLRQIWRPHFRQAARVLRTLEVNDDLGLSVEERKKAEEWLAKWESDLDRTLVFLATSATSRGLPHQITRALSFLNYGFHNYHTRRLYNSHNHPWNPSPDRFTNIAEQLEQIRKAEAKERRKAGTMSTSEKIWYGEGMGALEEVARMAEGTSGVWMGRVEMMKRRPEDRHKPGKGWAK